jgi:organic hydroperoxide reductase OsmC/OhrA
MSDVVAEFTIAVEQVDEYEFRVKFDKEQHANLLMDEPQPLGQDSAPNAARILAAAVGNCLSASLLFAARRNGLKVPYIHTQVRVQVVRNQTRRLRIGKLEVMIDAGIDESDRLKAAKCLDKFEDYCAVTESIRGGIGINVTVKGLKPQ